MESLPFPGDFIHITRPSSWRIAPIEKGAYGEQRNGKGNEPRKRWLNVIISEPGIKWHLRVTVDGLLCPLQLNKNSNRLPKRKEDLKELCQCVDFQRIKLINNSVTEIILSVVDSGHSGMLPPLRGRLSDGNKYAVLLQRLYIWKIREDPDRTIYPTYTGEAGTRTIPLSDIKVVEEIAHGAVYVAQISGEPTPVVYKPIERPFYNRRDSTVLEQELRNLELLRNAHGVVKLVAAVVSTNPYWTVAARLTESPEVLRGILTEYHPNGTLQALLKSPQPDGPWRTWALQITLALSSLHSKDIAHMDLKTSNIILSSDWKAILTDVSGIGGVTFDWLSPEMRVLPPELREIDNPYCQGFSIEAQKENDIWALGKLFSVFANVSPDPSERFVLRETSEGARQALPSRISLSQILRDLARSS